MRSIELTFDDETDAAFRTDWDALLNAGLPSQARHTSESNRPHLTIGAGATFPYGDESDDSFALGHEDARARRLRLISERCRVLPLDVRFTGLVVFGVPPRSLVLARLVVVSSEMLALHAAVHEVAPGATELTAPGAWTPHVTLAHRLTPDQLAESLSLVGAVAPGRAVGARLWDSGTRTTATLA